VGAKTFIGSWPVLRQLRGPDTLGRGTASMSSRSSRSETLAPRTSAADKVVSSVCPYCAVGCAQKVYVKDGVVTQIEGDPASPISRGRLCPKGSATRSLIQSPLREYKVKYRKPHSAHWEDLPLADAMDMIADRVIETRRQTWETSKETADGSVKLNRTLGIGSLGGATLDNEENYLIKKLLTGLGLVSVENQARI